ncbi:MAG: SUMF1/EgtB/PvdO family nonheme iron enzyme [Myxococcales bacterium]|nr:SUMF1/EgtB/PvdO family nonheme iron enzyme [Myxococcales bacterium]
MKRLLPWLTLIALAGCDDNNNVAKRDFGMPDPDSGMLCPGTGEPIQPERCDTRDNDCDGRADEDYNVDTDPDNCGRCGNICDFGNVDSACSNGRCIAVGGCPVGTYDRDDDLTNGCEGITCTVPADETCDDEDNDCDGRVDENFDRNVNVNNCGTCGNVCQFDNAQPFCDGGRCRIRQCDPGFGDIDGVASNGCEATCTPMRAGPEVCDGEDNDCDGRTDENFDRQTDPENCGRCGLRCGFANAAARCVLGACVLSQCDAGFVDGDDDWENGCETRCVPDQNPLELCDDRDNDCDGQVDEGFDKETDPNNCGGCGAVDPEAYNCNLPNTVPTCTGGECTTENCMPGFVDADGELSTGCETVCEPQNGGVETCNDEDDDCDGRIDEGYDKATDINHCGGCGRVCAFDHATASCESGRCVLRPDRCAPGYVDADQDPRTGCEYACVPGPGGAETCDGEGGDEDCDTRVDEGFDVFSELEHCGGCNQLCALAHAVPLCNNGLCDIGGCDPGWFDANGDIEDGCEVQCAFEEPLPETCDGADNDCDGSVDEDFDLTSDVSHCGRCDNACTFPNGRLSCVAQSCQVDGCLDGWFDANGVPDDGCELRCVRSNGGVESCDNRDNDCDGRADEGYDVTTDANNCGVCGNVCAYPNAQGICDTGRCRLQRCNPGFADIDGNPVNGCETACVPTPDGSEFCNDQDDDCDGRIDEGFDFESDIDHCGGCDQPCDVRNGDPFCNGGECAILNCLPGFVDLDRRVDTGCECAITNGGIEICDGVDNDCNGTVDDPERLVAPPEARCLSLGVCAGTAPRCQNAAWRCEYPAGYEAVEARCDGGDNDCDGRIDEAFEQLGRPCSDGLGICRNEGTLACAGPAGIACTAQAQNDRMRPEQCNGLDDDCDGVVDEDSDLTVNVPAGNGVPAFAIYVYEASRTDADAAHGGQSFARACSKPDALPWVNVDYATAAAACAASGLRLCSGAEWGRACAGPANQSYPYGNVYEADRCNGLDYDTNPATPQNDDDVLPTGARPRCTRDLGGGPVFDLSGNVWEWTSQDLSPAGDGSARAVRGGSAGNIDGGLTCQFDNATPVGAFRGNIGFRCCGAPR